MSSTISSFSIKSDLHLVRQLTKLSLPAVVVETPTNHVAIVDCSGSMASDLPKLRNQLKQRLPKLLKEGDTLSMIWFSGRGQYGALFEAEPVATLADLGDIYKLVDRWLKPVGLTGFKEPLEEVSKLVDRVSKKNKNPFAVFFMSDGHDNCSNRSDVLKVIEQVAGKLASATFVEYGYYADRPLLTAMAEKAGGQLIHADSFERYEPIFESALAKRPLGGKRVEVTVVGDVACGFAWTMDGGELTTFGIEGGKVHVPEQTEAVYYVVTGALQAASSVPSNEQYRSAAYAALSLYAVRMKPAIILPILRFLGDVALTKQFSGCFGKQRYSQFMAAAQSAAFDSKLRLLQGYDPNCVPADDAFTVLDLLHILSEDDQARIIFDHPSFRYSRVSRGRVDADENLSADEQLQLEAVRVQMAGEKSAKKLKELQGEIDKILANKRDALKFVADPAPNGYSISNLVYNETRPNVSVHVVKTGKVDLSSRSDHAKYKIPAEFTTHIHRNYTVICDGLVNIDKLPVTMSPETKVKLEKAGVKMDSVIGVGYGPDDVGPLGNLQGSVRQADSMYILHLDTLPVMNQVMINEATADAAIRLEWELTKKRAAQKVYKHYFGEMFPEAKTSQSFVDQYGKDGADWLKEQGFGYNGFAPKMVQAGSTDFIVGKELDVKLKGYSALPSVKDAKAKPNTPGKLMIGPIEEVETFVKTAPKNTQEKWLRGKTDATIAETRSLIYQTARQRFAIIVGQTWYAGLASLDDNVRMLRLDDRDITATFELREIEIKV